MDFLEDLELYNRAMHNAYDFITGSKDLDELIMSLPEHELYEFPLPFDPMVDDGKNPGTLDMLIEYFSEIEAYEKCAKLLKIREACSETSTE